MEKKFCLYYNNLNFIDVKKKMFFIALCVNHQIFKAFFSLCGLPLLSGRIPSIILKNYPLAGEENGRKKRRSL